MHYVSYAYDRVDVSQDLLRVDGWTQVGRPALPIRIVQCGVLEAVRPLAGDFCCDFSYYVPGMMLFLISAPT